MSDRGSLKIPLNLHKFGGIFRLHDLMFTNVHKISRKGKCFNSTFTTEVIGSDVRINGS